MTQAVLWLGLIVVAGLLTGAGLLIRSHQEHLMRDENESHAGKTLGL